MNCDVYRVFYTKKEPYNVPEPVVRALIYTNLPVNDKSPIYSRTLFKWRDLKISDAVPSQGFIEGRCREPNREEHIVFCFSTRFAPIGRMNFESFHLRFWSELFIVFLVRSTQL